VLGANGSTLEVTGYTVNDGNAGNNYSVTLHTATGTITAVSLNIYATTDSKSYDGTTSSSATPTTSGLQTGDTVTGLTQAFQSKNVLGVNGSTLQVTAYTVNDGNSGNNYTVTLHTATGTITARGLTVTATGINKVYDGNTTATVTLSTDKVSGDNVTASYTSASFADKNVGIGKAVSVSGISISGSDAGNYNLLNTTANTTANITAKHVTGSFTADNKVYNGNNSATVLTRSLSGVIPPDVVTLTGGTATFSDKNVGMGKTVTLTGATLSGADAGNYILDSVATTTANITPATVTAAIVGNPAKTYDGNTNATLSAANFSLTGVVTGESITVTKTTGVYNSKDVATATSVTTSMASGDFAAGVGTLLSNYVLPTSASGPGHINPAPLSITADSIVGTPFVDPFTKAYNGLVYTGFTVRYDGFVNGETLYAFRWACADEYRSDIFRQLPSKHGISTISFLQSFRCIREISSRGTLGVKNRPVRAENAGNESAQIQLHHAGSG